MPVLPDECHYLWRWFLSLHSERQSGFAPCQIPSYQIESWARLNQIRLTPWEVGTLRAMDAACLEASASERKNND